MKSLFASGPNNILASSCVWDFNVLNLKLSVAILVATLFTEQGPQALEITLREKDRLELKVGDNEISVNRQTGEMEVLFGARYATLTCDKSVFSM